MPAPRITDDDTYMITARLDGTCLHTWEYETEAERRLCMKLARAFQEGWAACNEHNKGRSDGQ